MPTRLRRIIRRYYVFSTHQNDNRILPLTESISAPASSPDFSGSLDGARQRNGRKAQPRIAPAPPFARMRDPD
jgi:hypothetical protein